MNEVEALRAVNFDWAMPLSEIWDDSAWDVPDLHAEIRTEFGRKLDMMRQDRTPLGWVVVGAGGTGKTHLLGAFRRAAAQRGAAFVLVDMTDVHSFWETVLQGYLDSLQQAVSGDTYQYQRVLHKIIEQLGPNKPVGQILNRLAERKSSDLLGDINKVLKALGQVHKFESLKHHNVVRALICLNSDDASIASLGMTWLQGQTLEDAERSEFGFSIAREQPKKIVEALSWLMSLSGPTILAFDQLDPIVTQLHYRQQGETSPAEEALAKAIIAEISGGLGALPDTARKTFTIVSCLESTWDILQGAILKNFADRFEPRWTLNPLGSGLIARAVVQDRLGHAYRSVGFTPPYESWPFRPEAFEELKLDSPREVLKRCDRHRVACLRDGKVTELTTFGQGAPTPPVHTNGEAGNLARLDERFDRLRGECDPAHLLEEKQEDQRMAPLLQNALRCLLHEHRLPDNVSGVVDSKFTGGATTAPLHARLRLIFEQENEREEHYCVRALEYLHAIAFQARLKAAMTQSGIDRSLKFRRLCVVRSRPVPGGAKTRQLTTRFEDAGGLLLKPVEDEIRTLHAVHQLKLAGDPDFDGWLTLRKPISRLAIVRQIVPSPLLVDGEPIDPPKPTPTPTPEPEPTPPPKPPPPPPPQPETARAESSAASRQTMFPLGSAVLGGRVGNLIEMPISLLEKHTLILAGAGSGKTVLVRRLVEEAVLSGVPSIVIDCANDLATLDATWDVPPETWRPGDHERAARYHRDAEVILWTPGRESGNPLALEPLPDLAAFADNDEELEAAVAMVREALGPVVAPGQSAASKNKLGILSRSLRYLAKNGGGSLKDFVALLDDLPSDAGLGLAQESKLAAQMADALKVAVETNPLLRSAGNPLDPAMLLGGPASARTRVSVVSFAGLPGLEAQRAFLNQLAMSLFVWIKQHPDPRPRPLRGLLVIDEAKDFVPAQRASTCKESLIRLTAQARKYHLGLVFATQNPKDIDNKIVANCSTHYYGKVNSPAAIEAVKDLIRAKGGTGDDVARLPRGQFYVHNADAQLASPTRVAIPMCLSRHPENPLDEAAVIGKAAASRSLLEGNPTAQAPPSAR